MGGYIGLVQRMLYFTQQLQNPMIQLYVAGALLVILIIVLVTLLILQRRCLKKLHAISDSLSYLHDSYVRTNLSLESVANRLETIEAQYTDFLINYEQSKVELTRMAEAVGGESQLTKAIDLARGGADAKEIMLTTGLGEDESNAIVKFHGTQKR